MKTHLNLATTNLSKSVEFYSALLDAQPAKLFKDYALFITDEPGLELALDLSDRVSPSTDAHYGICVETADDVERASARLKPAGLVASIEREETCCYANQTKVWSIDPDGRRWEVYTVHEETVERDARQTVCCSAGADERSCCR
jgi:catechol 2,3-dioxygenase-like lactoylglutathione lyase family enzyme